MLPIGGMLDSNSWCLDSLSRSADAFYPEIGSLTRLRQGRWCDGNDKLEIYNYLCLRGSAVLGLSG